MNLVRNARLGSAFTLIEIMIVVAIIGLLSAIAIPQFVHARTRSQTNTCISNLRTISGAAQQWALELKRAGDATVTIEDIRPYFRGIVVCPADAASNFDSSYALSVVTNSPACKILPAVHVMPAEEAP